MAKKTLTAAQVVEFLNTTNGRALKTDVVQHFLDQGLDVKINHISGVCWDRTGPLRSEKEYISLTSVDPLPQKVKAPKAPKAPKASVNPETSDEETSDELVEETDDSKSLEDVEEEDKFELPSGMTNFYESGEKNGMPLFRHQARNLFVEFNEMGLMSSYFTFRDGTTVSTEEFTNNVGEAVGRLIEELEAKYEDSDEVKNVKSFLSRLKRKM